MPFWSDRQETKHILERHPLLKGVLRGYRWALLSIILILTGQQEVEFYFTPEPIFFVAI